MHIIRPSTFTVGGSPPKAGGSEKAPINASPGIDRATDSVLCLILGKTRKITARQGVRPAIKASPANTENGMPKKVLEIGVGETTPDKKFSISCLRCVGACGLAPVVMVGEKVYGRVSPDGVRAILDEYK